MFFDIYGETHFITPSAFRRFVWTFKGGGTDLFTGSWLDLRLSVLHHSYLVDPASSHMLVSKIKPCMSKFTPQYGETANGSLNQSRFLR